MPTTALFMDIVTEASGHQITPCAPNMCITPAAPSPLPMPYPIMATSSNLDPGTEKTMDQGKKVLTTDGKAAGVKGNQPGTQKDITTMTTADHVWAIPVAVTVLFEGQPVIITGNPGFMNSR